MKNTILLLLLLTVSTVQSQNLLEYINDYERYSYELVKDTIKQRGYTNAEYTPVKNDKGEIIHYVITKKDTVWEDPDCPEYKGSKIFITSINGQNVEWFSPPSSGVITPSEIYYSDTRYNINNQTFRSLNEPSTLEPFKISVARDYVCECKRQEVIPFSKDFWNWIKKQGK